MIQLYQAGLSTNIVGRLTGYHKATVRDSLKRRGIALRPLHQRGPENKLWVGRCVDRKKGYIYLRVLEGDPLYVMASKCGRALEHRVMMARALGRPLTRDEHVHHINGVRGDNRIENLQLVRVGHPAGVRMRCLDCGSHHVEPSQMGDTA